MHFRAKNEMDPPVNKEERNSWERSSARALNVSLAAPSLRVVQYSQPKRVQYSQPKRVRSCHAHCTITIYGGALLHQVQVF